MRFLGGYQDTRTNKEDFAITPYLFGVWVTGDAIKIYGIGLCWMWMSGYIAIGFNVLKTIPSFIILKNKKENYE